MCRHLSFCASGCPAILPRRAASFSILCAGRKYLPQHTHMHTHLLIKSSKPCRRSSMNSVSKMPSSLAQNATWRLIALVGSDGTTILPSRSSSIFSHSKSLYLLLHVYSFCLKMGRLVCGRGAASEISTIALATCFFLLARRLIHTLKRTS